MIRTSLLALALAGVATAALAQTPTDPHAGHVMPAQPPAPVPAAPRTPDPHAGHQAAPAQPPADPHAGHAMAGAAAKTGADLAVGAAPAPAPITDLLADGVYGPESMRRARALLAEEHGGVFASKIHADLLEWAPDGEGYRWEIEGWYGGDRNRLAFKTEGEGRSGEGVEQAEVQFLYSRAVSRYTDVQAGVRFDVEPRSRAYAVLAVDALFPYWFEAEGSLFLSEEGDLLARAEGSHDVRLSQRLVLQPRAELNFAAQDIPGSAIGSGLSTSELGLRLRYEFRREFAPYIGVNYERRHGETADFARAVGEPVSSTGAVVGVRAWF